ncbi:MAG TPA: O-antigen ligase family protein [Candidatus Saccharimonadales bacterium]|nr:O-antigen ligase family protein [Candidatus Saccharimonadales bacterium]
MDIYIKFEQVLLPVVIGVYLLLMLAGAARPIRLNGLFVAGAIYMLCILISIWYGSEVLGQVVITRDLFELPKVWLPVIFFTMAYEVEWSESALKRLFVFFGFAIAFVCFYAWSQWANLSFTYTLNQLYSAGNHDDALFGARRVYATVGNPNILGMVMTWALAAFVMAAINRIGNFVWNIVLTLGCLVTLAMTGSRYGLITGSFTFLLILLLPSASPQRRRTQLGFLIALVPILAFMFTVVATSNQHTLERFQTLRNPLQADSLRERLDSLWPNALSDIAKSPFFGRGPAKSIYTGIITDSEYLDVLKQFGIIGFFPYFAYFLFPLYMISRGMLDSRRAGHSLENLLPATVTTLRLSLVIVITVIIVNIEGSSFYNVPLQAFLWMWMGVGARCAMSIREAALTCGSIAAPVRQPGYTGPASPKASLVS